ncbi:hypothetical protein BCM43_28580 (plasmid) [Bacillus thuringiensis]|nr:hypothetical protein BCM43_28580 [Bacillus thuringiensis]
MGRRWISVWRSQKMLLFIFKSKKDRKSYTANVVNRNFMLLNGHIKLLKLKMVHIKQHREDPTRL